MKKVFTAIVVVGAVSLGGLRGGPAIATAPVVEVFKSPTCGCCANWVKHLEANGFKTTVTDVEDMSQVKAKYGVPGRAPVVPYGRRQRLRARRARAGADVQRLIKERPAVVGVAVPGMPVGSPGMEVGNTVQPYNVLTFDKQGQTTVFASHGR